ncbi:hypothetical protein Tco_1537360, partial [Tanacetum coccineum]
VYLETGSDQVAERLMALREIGVVDVTGVEVVESLPLVDGEYSDLAVYMDIQVGLLIFPTIASQFLELPH